MKENWYLGDDVHASFDGYRVILAVNNPENYVVSLEPEVLKTLLLFVEYLNEKEDE